MCRSPRIHPDPVVGPQRAKAPVEEINAQNEAFGEKANLMCRSPRIHPDPVVGPQHVEHEEIETKESRCPPMVGAEVIRSLLILDIGQAEPLRARSF